MGYHGLAAQMRVDYRSNRRQVYIVCRSDDMIAVPNSQAPVCCLSRPTQCEMLRILASEKNTALTFPLNFAPLLPS